MADPVSNADLDLTQVSREGVNSTYVEVKPEAEDAGQQVAQILGKPTPAKDEKPSSDAGSKSK